MRRVGKLYGKTIVEGDPNIVKDNEIHLKDAGDIITLSKRNSEGDLTPITGGSSDIKYKYYNTRMLYDHPKYDSDKFKQVFLTLPAVYSSDRNEGGYDVPDPCLNYPLAIMSNYIENLMQVNYHQMIRVESNVPTGYNTGHNVDFRDLEHKLLSVDPNGDGFSIAVKAAESTKEEWDKLVSKIYFPLNNAAGEGGIVPEGPPDTGGDIWDVD